MKKLTPQRIEALTQFVRELLMEIMRDLPQTVRGFLSAQMETGTPSEAWRSGESKEAFPLEEATWSTSKRLRIRGGKLIRSFKPKKQTTSGDVFQVEIGSDLPYARIHEHGGFIRSKGRMEKFFWAMYYKAKKANPFWKIMAMSVMKKGGVTIPKRPYIEPARKEFEEKVVGRIEAKLMNEIAKYM